MAFDLSTLEPLAAQLARAGAPILANTLGTVLPFPANLIAKTVIGSLAAAFGANADDPQDLANKIAADPDAAAKLQSVTDEHATDIASALDFARLQTDATDRALALEPSFWGRLYVGGARPGMMWVGVFVAIYQIVAAARGGTLIPFDVYAATLATFGALAGVRGYEMVKGVARTSLVAPAAKLAPPVRGK
jgi:hypothetical protein